MDYGKHSIVIELMESHLVITFIVYSVVASFIIGIVKTFFGYKTICDKGNIARLFIDVLMATLDGILFYLALSIYSGHFLR